MWPFKRKSIADKLRGYKKITVGGMRFTIRKLNPFLDFKSESMPQIFTDFASAKEKPVVTPEMMKKYQEDMFAIITAGVVDPHLSKEGITASDLFRDGDIGVSLYREILDHSFNKFRGLKKVFFSTLIKYRLYTAWRKHTGHYRAVLLSRTTMRPS